MSQFTKISVLLVAVLSVGILGGCGSKEDEPPKATAQELERQKTEAQAGGGPTESANTADLNQTKR